MRRTGKTMASIRLWSPSLLVFSSQVSWSSLTYSSGTVAFPCARKRKKNFRLRRVEHSYCVMIKNRQIAVRLPNEKCVSFAKTECQRFICDRCTVLCVARVATLPVYALVRNATLINTYYKTVLYRFGVDLWGRLVSLDIAFPPLLLLGSCHVLHTRGTPPNILALRTKRDLTHHRPMLRTDYCECTRSCRPFEEEIWVRKVLVQVLSPLAGPTRAESF